MKPAASRFKGRWKIVWMEMWDQDFVDEDVPGHVTFGDKGGGEFQFGYVCGSFAWSAKDDHVDSLWEGNDEMELAHGDIHCRLETESCTAPSGFSAVTSRIFVLCERRNRPPFNCSLSGKPEKRSPAHLRTSNISRPGRCLNGPKTSLARAGLTWGAPPGIFRPN